MPVARPQVIGEFDAEFNEHIVLQHQPVPQIYAALYRDPVAEGGTAPSTKVWAQMQ